MQRMENKALSQSANKGKDNSWSHPFLDRLLSPPSFTIFN